MSIAETANKYNEVMGPIIFMAEKPTNESIARIERELGVKLPGDLVGFAKSSEYYGNWLASIGPDYDSPTHIININIRLREEGSMPLNFIAINVGYDDDWDCIDLDTYEESTGEYLITYWAPDVSLQKSALYGSFGEYTHSLVNYWSRNA